MRQRRTPNTSRAAPQAPRARPAPKGSRTRIAIAAAAAIVVAAVVGGVLVARGTGPAQAVSSASSSTVSLSGTDPVTGRQVSLADYAGTPVVVNIWASWCTGCEAEARDLAAFAAAHPDVQMVGIDTQDTRADAKRFYREFGWKHPSIEDGSGALAAKLGLQGLPTTLFLDRNHRLVTKIVGATDLAGFESGLQAALAAS